MTASANLRGECFFYGEWHGLFGDFSVEPNATIGDDESPFCSTVFFRETLNKSVILAAKKKSHL